MRYPHHRHLFHLPTSEQAARPQDLVKPDDLTWRDYLLMLLHIDAGIEHGLMVQYLYAAYSLGGDQVPPDKRALVRRWQQTLLSIAKEEMGHLLTVQNVITCLGGALELDRQDYPWDHDFYPFPFELEPLTLDSLAKYVYTEAPEGWGQGQPHSTALKRSIKRNKASVLQRVVHGRVPLKPNVKSVSALFKVVLEVVSDPQRIPDETFEGGTFAQQACWAAWARNHGQVSGEDAQEPLQDGEPTTRPKPTCPTQADVLVVPVATRDDVILALKQVAEQGEATHDELEKSHFARFLEVYEEFEKAFPEGSPVSPSRPLPINPTTLGRIHRQDGDMSQRETPITHPVTRQWAALFDLRYRLLLTGLLHTFRLPRHTSPYSSAGTYQALTHRTFGEMYNLKALADILVRSPLHPEGQPFQPAGPAFQMPYTLELPANPLNIWLQYNDILQACATLRIQILEVPSLSSNQRRYLLAMADCDREMQCWLATQIDDARRVTMSACQG